jgi:hypothetical protein
VTTERAGTVGAHWETELRRYEVVVPDDDGGGSPFGWDDPPQSNRATRRRARRDARRTPVRIAETTDQPPDRP